MKFNAMRYIIKVLTVVVFVFLIAVNVYGQKIYLGLGTGIVSDDLFGNTDENLFKNSFYSIGYNVEYIPKKAMFSVSSEVKYFFNEDKILMPLSLNLLLGKRINFSFTGSLVPLIRVNAKEPNATLGIGRGIGAGINYAFSRKYMAFASFQEYFITEKYYRPLHIGGTSVDSYTNTFKCLTIGIKYLILSFDS